MPEPLKMTTSGDREVVIERRFDASRAQVWRAISEAELMQRWMLGPPGWSMPVCTVDLRVGGRLRYEWAHEDGRVMGLTSVFKELVPDERMVATELFDEDWTGGETLVTQTLHDVDGGTLLRTHILYASQEARDGAVKVSGMSSGMEAGYARLDQMFAEGAVAA
ncbi:SRPBCC family protein [Brevundimonas lenta]|uniref:Uncharacterized protein YndB with AHSA1/START domain n=1 Tax=Brevundimonas lenta TaxID=424796 RepID=A0A7W6NPQ3_9CAUL|nr:SRPBCC family protein [Brevundimonas lenta]MBB4082397.1 uncharacterized protein YndB with AHSA1/START domain [Brevundimonas lenta]